MTADTLIPPSAPLTAVTRPRPPATPRRRRAERVNWSLTTILILCALTVVVPLYVTITMAFKTPAQSADGNAFSLPFPFNPASFSEAWKLTRYPVTFAISLGIAAAAVLLVLALASAASYAIVRHWNHRFFRYSFFYLLAAMFLPFQVIALPEIKLTAMIGLDNPVGVAIIQGMLQLAFSVLLYTAYLRSIPIELEESARIDGATTWQVFRRIILPLLGPMNATVGIFAFLFAWNDYMTPSLITAAPTAQTLPVVQQLFQSQFGTNYNVAFASYLMAMAPTIIVYIFAQRWVISGITQGAVKS